MFMRTFSVRSWSGRGVRRRLGLTGARSVRAAFAIGVTDAQVVRVVVLWRINVGPSSGSPGSQSHPPVSEPERGSVAAADAKTPRADPTAIRLIGTARSLPRSASQYR